ITANSTDANEDFHLTVTSTATDGTDTANTAVALHDALPIFADAPNLSAPLEVSGAEDSAIAIPITTSLVESGAADPDASLATVVAGMRTRLTSSDGANSFTATDANH